MPRVFLTQPPSLTHCLPVVVQNHKSRTSCVTHPAWRHVKPVVFANLLHPGATALPHDRCAQSQVKLVPPSCRRATTHGLPIITDSVAVSSSCRRVFSQSRLSFVPPKRARAQPANGAFVYSSQVLQIGVRAGKPPFSFPQERMRIQWREGFTAPSPKWEALLDGLLEPVAEDR